MSIDEIQACLDAARGASRDLPLTAAHFEALPLPNLLPATELFPGAFSAEGALAGLLLYCGEWTRAHEIAQELHSREGSYWHAIVHRLEPDSWNSMYWFRQTGRHPIFAALLEESRWIRQEFPDVTWEVGPEWDPARLVDLCDQGRRQPGSSWERLARRIQMAEWRLLFRYCERTRW